MPAIQRAIVWLRRRPHTSFQCTAELAFSFEANAIAPISQQSAPEYKGEALGWVEEHIATLDGCSDVSCHRFSENDAFVHS
jgi:hypothetical protein